MSCHSIGAGMNAVVEEVIKMYDASEISKDATLKIIAKLRKGVHWCDGNEYEAVESIRECRCGRCLKVMEQGERLYSVWEVSHEVPDKYGILDNKWEVLASDGLCEDCFDIVLDRHAGCVGVGKKERQYINRMG